MITTAKIIFLFISFTFLEKKHLYFAIFWRRRVIRNSFIKVIDSHIFSSTYLTAKLYWMILRMKFT